MPVTFWLIEILYCWDFSSILVWISVWSVYRLYHMMGQLGGCATSRTSRYFKYWSFPPFLPSWETLISWANRPRLAERGMSQLRHRRAASSSGQIVSSATHVLLSRSRTSSSGSGSYLLPSLHILSFRRLRGIFSLLHKNRINRSWLNLLVLSCERSISLVFFYWGSYNGLETARTWH